MISEIRIENFKSIANLSIKLGSLTVLIGENGSGKSNILEAIGFGAAAAAGKLDDEFLYNRGIRVTAKKWMRSAFIQTTKKPKPIRINILGEKNDTPLNLSITTIKNDKTKLETWYANHRVNQKEIDQVIGSEGFTQELEDFKQKMFPNSPDIAEETIQKVYAYFKITRDKRRKIPEIASDLTLSNYLIYAPENSILRNFDTEGAIKPLGPKGEGLLKHLLEIAPQDGGSAFSELKNYLKLLGWFGDLHLPSQEDEIKGTIRIKDKWLIKDGETFDQRSANEGFLFLLFYFTLLLSEQTPKFLAIDNIDNSLNPKLCIELIKQISILAEKSGRQVICTTHNPAILDGLNLSNENQKLYVVRRNSDGHTLLERVLPPNARPDGPPIRLSTAFTSGLLGGLPEHF